MQMPELDADFEISTNNLEAEYEISEGEHFDCSFEIFASGTVWGAITGNIENQTDLIAALEAKADVTTVEALSDDVETNTNNITVIQNTIDNYGNAVLYDASDFATAEQGAKADTAVQPSVLEDYATTSDLSTGLASKQDTISDLNTIRSNASNGNTAYNTIQGYGDIVTYNASNFATSIQGGLADTALQPNDNITELNNNAGYITSASLPTVNNSSIKFQKNGTDVKTITLNQSGNDTVNFSIPTQASDINAVPTSRTINNKSLANNISLSASDVGALASTTTINDLTTTTQQNALNSGATSTNIGQITTNANNISDIQDLIPTQATTTNQLADKSFVNSSIATNTAYFIGTFQSVAELEAYSGTLTNNDYAFVETTDSAGNTLYDRYKWNGTEWLFEYELNNSSFTSNQWAAINSGANSTNIGQIATNTNDIQTINTTIGGYGDIVTHNTSEFATASQGSKADTALQPNDNISELNNDSGYITGITSSDVTTALGYTPYDNSNPDGYITGITSSDVTTALGYTPYNSTNPNGYMPTKPAITNSTNLSTLDTGVYPVNGIANSDLPSTSRMFGTLIQYDGTYRPQLLIAGFIAGDSSVTGVYNRRYLTSASSYTAWEKLGEGTVKSVNNISPNGSGDVSLTIPTVNDGILTITQNGTEAGTFSANQSGNDTISLTDTTYTTFTGADSITGGTSGLVPAPSAGDEEKYLCGGGSFEQIDYSQIRNTPTIPAGLSDLTVVAGSNISISGDTISATDTTYSNFVGADSVTAGASGLVPAPSAGDEEKFLKANGTWDTISVSGGANTDLSNLTATGEAHFQEPLVSGTNIKTINSNSILGSGDLTISASVSPAGSSTTPIYVNSSGVPTSCTGINKLWIIPNYNSLSTISSLPWTAPSNCFAFVSAERTGTTSNAGYITVNGSNVIYFKNISGYTAGSATAQLFVKQGDKVNVSGGATFSQGKYCSIGR